MGIKIKKADIFFDEEGELIKKAYLLLVEKVKHSDDMYIEVARRALLGVISNCAFDVSKKIGGN